MCDVRFAVCAFTAAGGARGEGHVDGGGGRRI